MVAGGFQAGSEEGTQGHGRDTRGSEGNGKRKRGKEKHGKEGKKCKRRQGCISELVFPPPVRSFCL